MLFFGFISLTDILYLLAGLFNLIPFCSPPFCYKAVLLTDFIAFFFFNVICCAGFCSLWGYVKHWSWCYRKAIEKLSDSSVQWESRQWLMSWVSLYVTHQLYLKSRLFLFLQLSIFVWGFLIWKAVERGLQNFLEMDCLDRSALYL